MKTIVEARLNRRYHTILEFPRFAQFTQPHFDDKGHLWISAICDTAIEHKSYVFHSLPSYAELPDDKLTFIGLAINPDGMNRYVFLETHEC